MQGRSQEFLTCLQAGTPLPPSLLLPSLRPPLSLPPSTPPPSLPLGLHHALSVKHSTLHQV